MTTPTPDWTLDEIATQLIGDVAANAAFDGWTATAVRTAAATRGIDTDVARLALPDTAAGLIDRWFASVDAQLAQTLPAEKLATMKIRERIRSLIAERLAIVAPHKEALRRALAILALPQNVPLATRLAWRSADHMWRLAGDTASDFNHYTKRMTLGAVYASTVAVFMNDTGDTHEDTLAFLDRRIDDVMRFEKAKYELRQRRDHWPSLSRFIGRLRYPSV